jgi:hypothetical protein
MEVVSITVKEEIKENGIAVEQEPSNSWTETIKNAPNIYRIREFVITPAKCKDADRWGRNPALYCITNGVIMNGISFLCRQHTYSSHGCEFMATTHAIDSFQVRPTGMTTAQWNLDRLFCAMQPGGIICGSKREGLS